LYKSYPELYKAYGLRYSYLARKISMASNEENRTPGFKNAEKDRIRAESENQENNEGVVNHQKAAAHFALASKLHYDAARLHNEGNHAKADQCAIRAIGHAAMAIEHQLADAKNHAVENQEKTV
jgi:hypothetical protein